VSTALTIEKRGGGRPTKYDPVTYPELAFKYCLLGADDAALARNFEVTEQTITNWKHEHPEFFASIKAGRDEADANVAHSLYHRAKGYSRKAEKIVFDKDGNELRAEYIEHMPPDPTSMIFWLKNRRRTNWRDTPTVAVGVQAAGENITINMQPGEIAQGYINLIETNE
jgi:hypothetical protein